MRRSIIGISLIVFAALTISISSCKEDDNGGTTVSSNDGFKIAYINRDSLADQYDYYNDMQTAFMVEQQEKEGELGSRYKALQRKYMQIQRDLQNRMITQSSAESKNQQLVLDQQKWQQDQERYSIEMQEKLQKMTLQILDSIKNYVEIYNKDHHYNMILNNDTLGSIVIYADEMMNITDDIVKGLNKRYRDSVDKPADAIKETNEKAEEN